MYGQLRAAVGIAMLALKNERTAVIPFGVGEVVRQRGLKVILMWAVFMWAVS